jgi:hypothetical protein
MADQKYSGKYNSGYQYPPTHEEILQRNHYNRRKEIEHESIKKEKQEDKDIYYLLT